MERGTQARWKGLRFNMGSGQKAAAMVAEEEAQDELHKKLAQISVYQWEVFTNEVTALVKAVREGSIMNVAEQALYVESQLDDILKRS